MCDGFLKMIILQEYEGLPSICFVHLLNGKGKEVVNNSNMVGIRGVFILPAVP